MHLTIAMRIVQARCHLFEHKQYLLQNYMSPSLTNGSVPERFTERKVCLCEIVLAGGEVSAMLTTIRMCLGRKRRDVQIPDHVHRLIALQRSPCCLKRKIAHPRFDESFDKAMVLLDDGVEVFDCLSSQLIKSRIMLILVKSPDTSPPPSPNSYRAH